MSRWVVWLPLAIFAVLVGFFQGIDARPKCTTLGVNWKACALLSAYRLAYSAGADESIPASQTVFNQCLGELVYYLSGRASVSHGAIQKLPIVGLNYKDSETAAKNWLAKLGDPYTTQIFDPNGRLGLDLGVAGAPETFLVDARKVIRLRIQGEVNDRAYQRQIQPLLETLK